MVDSNPEATSFNPILIAQPTAFDMAYMISNARPRAASDPGLLPRDSLNRLDLPLLPPTPLITAFGDPCPEWNLDNIVETFAGDEYMPGPLNTGMVCEADPHYYAEPEQICFEQWDRMFYFPESFCLPPPALPMEPISEVAPESQSFYSNNMFGYDPNTPFPVPGPTAFIMERAEEDADDDYVVFGLNDPSEHTEFGRMMAEKHSMPQLAPVNIYQDGPAAFYDEGLDMEGQAYYYESQGYFGEGAEHPCEGSQAQAYEAEEVKIHKMVTAQKSNLNPEAPDFTRTAESNLNPEAAEFEVNVVTFPGLRTPSSRLQLAMQPLMMRAKRLSIEKDDLNLGRISWVDWSSWFPESDAE